MQAAGQPGSESRDAPHARRAPVSGRRRDARERRTRSGAVRARVSLLRAVALGRPASRGYNSRRVNERVKLSCVSVCALIQFSYYAAAAPGLSLEDGSVTIRVLHESEVPEVGISDYVVNPSASVRPSATIESGALQPPLGEPSRSQPTSLWHACTSLAAPAQAGGGGGASSTPTGGMSWKPGCLSS